MSTSRSNGLKRGPGAGPNRQPRGGIRMQCRLPLNPSSWHTDPQIARRKFLSGDNIAAAPYVARISARMRPVLEKRGHERRPNLSIVGGFPMRSQTPLFPLDRSLGPDYRGYALSIKQPWAALLVHGRKTIEVRRWPTARRGRILIHAARLPDPRPEAWQQVPKELLQAARLM